ncbi:hypothetical protein SAMN05192573_116116 [Mucilaginibacter gossypii]|uniref:Uncharacterized protein n=1 Tax=Mucilaginibacter gossypii TaxID=551996 RepID=A0A1G8I3U2_9SPHI|nr:hypothetical protein SAMN05192573_116116 [Mucilaginibacter gossypii]
MRVNTAKLNNYSYGIYPDMLLSHVYYRGVFNNNVYRGPPNTSGYN